MKKGNTFRPTNPMADYDDLFLTFFKSTSTKDIITNSMLEGRKSQRVAMLNT